MFARMTILQIVPEDAEEAIDLFRRSVVPEAKKQRGYRGACLLSDVKQGKAIAVTFWRNEADAVANEESRYYQEQLVKFLRFFSGPPIREGYAVNVHAMKVSNSSAALSASGSAGAARKARRPHPSSGRASERTSARNRRRDGRRR